MPLPCDATQYLQFHRVQYRVIRCCGIVWIILGLILAPTIVSALPYSIAIVIMVVIMIITIAVVVSCSTLSKTRTFGYILDGP